MYSDVISVNAFVPVQMVSDKSNSHVAFEKKRKRNPIKMLQQPLHILLK